MEKSQLVAGHKKANSSRMLRVSLSLQPHQSGSLGYISAGLLLWLESSSDHGCFKGGLSDEAAGRGWP